jgi:hypothetical protein
MKKVAKAIKKMETHLIDARITELDNWRGEMLARIRAFSFSLTVRCANAGANIRH